MTGKIKLSTLLENIKDTSTSDETVRPYLRVERSITAPNDPAVVFDEKKVDMEGRVLSPSMQAFSIMDGDMQKRQRRYREKIAAGWPGLRLLSEGDSWFQFPIILDDIIDCLVDRYAIFCVATAGDTLQNMKAGLPALKRLIDAEQFHGFLISGGGNDVLVGERLEKLLRGFHPDRRKAADYVIMSRLKRQIADVLADYADIFAFLTGAFPRLRIFCHGYDWAQSRFDGKYIHPVMRDKEVPERFRDAIIKIMVDEYNGAMRRHAAKSVYNGAVIYVDCRDSVKNSWFDEIHPTDAGFRRVARRFSQAIDGALTPLVA